MGVAAPDFSPGNWYFFRAAIALGRRWPFWPHHRAPGESGVSQSRPTRAEELSRAYDELSTQR